MLKKMFISFCMSIVAIFPVRAEEAKSIIPEWTYKWLLHGKWWAHLSSDSITYRYWYPIHFLDGNLRINVESRITKPFSSKPCYLELTTINSGRTNAYFFQDYQKLKKQYPNTTLYTMAQNPPVMLGTNQDIKINPVLAYQDELVASTSGVYASIYYYLIDDESKTSAISLLCQLTPSEFSPNYNLNWDNIFYLSETERIYVYYSYQPGNLKHNLEVSYLSIF